MSDDDPVQQQALAEGDAPVEGEAAEGGEADVPLARLTDRFLAYAIDALLFLIPCQLTLRFWCPTKPVPPEASLQWHLIWVGLYTAYQAILNAGEGATLGKRLLGLRVVTLEGEAPGFARSLARALAYIPSGALFDLGFAWALLNPMRRGWHDLVAGTVVLEVEERGGAFRGASSIASAALLAFCFFLSIRPILRGHSVDAEAAGQALDYLAGLEEQYKAQTGAYTEDPAQLARLAGGGKAFKDKLFDTIQPQGFGIKIGPDGYAIVAVALDGSKVSRRGPAK